MAHNDNNNENNDDKRERSRLVNPLALLIMTVVLVVALVLLFPARRFTALTQKPNGGEGASSTSITYLQALLRANPDDHALRIKLAEQLVLAGEAGKARDVIGPLAQTHDPDVQWLFVQLAWTAFSAVEPGNPERAQRRGELIARMDIVQSDPHVSTARLETLAKRWLAIGKPGRAAVVFERIGRQQPDQAYAWYSRAGQWWQAANEPTRSAHAWQLAFQATDDSRQQHEAALAALDAARQTGDASSVDMASEFIRKYPDDPTFLDIGIDVAIAQNRLDVARKWSKRYVALNPNDQAALERDARIALASDHLNDALAGLQKLVANNPDNPDLRARLAQVQIWAGQPEAALANYERLARNSGSNQYDQKILDLAQQLHDTDAVLAALDRIRRRGSLNASQRALLVDILNSEGEPDRAIALAQQWTHGGRTDRALWVRLAQLQTLTGDLEGALTTWRQIAHRFGRAFDETQARGQLLIQKWQLQDALARLLSLKNKPSADTDEHAYYWETIGALAWTFNNPDTARKAYYQLYLERKLDANNYLRLAQSAADTGHLDMAMEVARTDWRENQHAEMIVRMLGIAERDHRDDLKKELFALASQHSELFADSAEYWQLYGNYQYSQRNLDAARKAYLKSLAIAPDDAGTRSALLYTLLESSRDDELRRYVTAWRASAWNDPRQWQAFAAAYSHLGETRRALPWFDKAVREDHDNYLLVLDYADALERGRRFESARRMRRYALTKLRPRLLRDLAKKGVLSKDKQAEDARVLNVQAAMLAPDATRGWLRAALKGRQGGTLTPVDIETLLGYYISQSQPAYARYWLLQAHRRRLKTEAWQRLVVALQNDNQVAMQDILQRHGDDNGIGISDRISALRQLDYRARALTLALDNERPDAPYVAGADVVPRYAAELYRQMPQNVGTEFTVSGVSNLATTSEGVFLRLSGEHLSSRLEVGTRQLNDNGGDIDIGGLDNERFADLELDWRQRRGLTTLHIGTVTTEAKDIFQLGLRQDWQLTDHVDGAFFASYNNLPDETSQLRALGVSDEVGATFDWTLNPRDSVSLTAAYSSFYSRDQRNDLGDGYRLEGTVAHSLNVGPTHQIQLRAFANTEQNSLVNDLPADVADRLPAGTNVEDVVPRQFSFIGAGVSIARGSPGEEYPVVASPRYRLDLNTGYVLPDNKLGLGANFSIGTAILGSDELSLNFGVSQTGGGSRDNSYNGTIKYQYFLGR